MMEIGTRESTLGREFEILLAEIMQYQPEYVKMRNKFENK